MASAIDNSWGSQETSRSERAQAHGNHKKGEALVAQENRSLQTLAKMQAETKDTMLPVSVDFVDETNFLMNGSNGKLQLPNPQTGFNALQNDPREQGLISIIGAVMREQIKTNINVMQNYWKQASQSMMAQVKFAPIIGNAIRNAYDAQSQATTYQADQAFAEGMIGAFAFGFAVIGGTAAEFTDDTNALNKPGGAGGLTDEVEEGLNAKTNIEEPQPNANGNEEAAANAEGSPQQLNNEAKQLVDKEGKAFGNRASDDLKGTMNGTKTGLKRFSSWLFKVQTAVQTADLGQKAISQVAVTKHYQTLVAKEQKKEGTQQALSKESEQYAQFFGQDFSRTEDQRQGVTQSIDYTLNLWKNAADTVTQNVSSMFRG